MNLIQRQERKLFVHLSFAERLLFAVIGSLIFSFDSPLDSNSMIVSGIPAGIVKVLKTGWNIKKSCDSLLPK